MSKANDDLPEPLTHVTTVRAPSGSLTVTELTALLKECFDGEGAVERVGGEDLEGVTWEGSRRVKPGGDGFEDAFQATLSGAGYEFAVPDG